MTMYTIPPYYDISAMLPGKYRPMRASESSVVLTPAVFPWGGSGFFAGDYPTGITTVEGVPAAAQVFVLARTPGVRTDMAVVARLESDHTGAWRAEGVDPGMTYTIVGRKAPFNDVIVAGVTPANPPRFLPAVVDVPIGAPLNKAMPLYGGEGNIANPILLSGTFPPGVALTGKRLTATWPTGAPGEYPLVFELTDDAQTAAAPLTVRLILLPLVLSVTPSLPATLYAGAAAPTVVFSADGGEGPYTYQVSAGALPAGMALSGGVLSGTPSAAGAYNFTIKVTDARGGSASRNNSVQVATMPKRWRILYVGPTAGTNFAQLGEVMFGGVRATGGTASASSTYSGYPAANAFNGVVTDSGWCSAGGAADGQWIAYDFKADKVFNSVTLVAASSTDSQYAPAAFKVQSSANGTVWNDIASFAALPAWGASEARTFAW